MDLTNFDKLYKDLTTVTRNQLTRVLEESGCCHICLCRFEHFVNKFPSQPLVVRTETNGVKNGVEQDSLCFVCLGLLGSKEMECFIKQISDAVKDANYESLDFVLSVTVVQIVEIRQMLLAHWLKERFPDLSTDSFLDSVVPIKQVLKDSLIEGLSPKLGLTYRTNSRFDVIVDIEATDTRFFQVFEALDPETFVLNTRRKRRNKKTPHQIFSRKSTDNFFAKHSKATLESHFPFPPRVEIEDTANPFKLSVTLEHEPVFIGGRYNKYSRKLPQTPWVLDGVRMRESSVEESIVEPLRHVMPAASYKFSSSGREDVDVRCLGDGRPFVVECINPRRQCLSETEFLTLEKSIEDPDKIVVKDLKMVSEAETAWLRKQENDKKKHYAADCHAVERLTESDMNMLMAIRDLDIVQKTPIRVLHRRPLMQRSRRVHSIYYACLADDDHHFQIKLETEAGTYIKEFVHGDLGRTQPNLKEILGKGVDILNLDVVKVDVVWPLTDGVPTSEETGSGDKPDSDDNDFD